MPRDSRAARSSGPPGRRIGWCRVARSDGALGLVGRRATALPGSCAARSGGLPGLVGRSATGLPGYCAAGSGGSLGHTVARLLRRLVRWAAGHRAPGHSVARSLQAAAASPCHCDAGAGWQPGRGYTSSGLRVTRPPRRPVTASLGPVGRPVAVLSGRRVRLSPRRPVRWAVRPPRPPATATLGPVDRPAAGARGLASAPPGPVGRPAVGAPGHRATWLSRRPVTA